MSAPQGLGGWADMPFWQEQWPALRAALAADSRQILPPEDQRFAALQLCPPTATRVVILGQDPYPTPGHAHGLAFSVAPGTALPRSLVNIFKEMQSDLGACPAQGDLRPWARQGVLLLNTALTVPAGQAGGHARLGWDALIDQVLARCAQKPTAFVLWGAKARARLQAVVGEADMAGHLVLRSAHPSPLSARRGFFGSRPFSRINQWLEAAGQPPIVWTQGAEETA